jgi:hypothetical protein
MRLQITLAGFVTIVTMLIAPSVKADGGCPNSSGSVSISRALNPVA